LVERANTKFCKVAQLWYDFDYDKFSKQALSFNKMQQNVW